MTTDTKATPNKQASWRDVLPVHPAAELFPMMSEAELRELGEDIKKNGLQHYCTVIEVAKSTFKMNGKSVALLDGRNRLDAIELVAGKFDAFGDCECGGMRYRVLPAEADPYAFALSANIQRRHLTAEQRSDLIEKVLKAKPDQSNRAIAKQVKADHKTVGKVRKEMEGRGDVPHVKTRTDTKGRKQPAKRKPAAQKVFDSPHGNKVSKNGNKVSEDEATFEELITAVKAALAKGDECLAEAVLAIIDMMDERQRLRFHEAYGERKFGKDIVERCVRLFKSLTDEQQRQFFAEIRTREAAEESAVDDLEIPACLRRVAP